MFLSAVERRNIMCLSAVERWNIMFLSAVERRSTIFLTYSLRMTHKGRNNVDALNSVI